MSTIHIAGLAVLMGRHGRQRCAWCGDILFEVFGDEMVAVAPGSDTTPSRPWQERAFIEVTKDGPSTLSVHIQDTWGEDMPPNSCLGPPKLRAIRGEKP